MHDIYFIYKRGAKRALSDTWSGMNNPSDTWSRANESYLLNIS